MDRNQHVDLTATTARSRLLSASIAGLMIVAGGFGVIGWLLGIERFYRPFLLGAPLRLLPAVCLVLLGAAQLFMVQGGYRIARGVALVPFLLGCAALLFPARWLHVLSPFGAEHAIAPAVACSLGIILASLALIVMVTRADWLPSVFVVGTLGVTLVALNLAVLFMMLLVADGGEQSSRLVGASLPTAVSLLLLGIHLTHEAWGAGWSPGAVPLWVPVAMGLASLTAVVFLWRALLAAQRDEGLGLMRAVAASSGDAATRKFDAVRASLWRAAVFSRLQPPTREAWDQYVGGVVRDLPGLDALAWVPAGNGDPRFFAVTARASAALGGLTAQLRTKDLVPEPSLVTEDSIKARVLDARPMLVTAVLPRCRGTVCDGWIVGVVDPAILLTEALADTLYGYHRELSWQGRPVVFGLEPPSAVRQWVDSSEVRFGGLEWGLRVWPTTGLLRRMQSDLPQAVLVLGLLLSCLLPATAQLARSVVSQQRRSEQERLGLALGRSMDRTWSWEVPRHPEPDPRIFHASPTHETRAGRWSKLVHPEDQRMVDTLLGAHLAGRTAVFESEYRVSDGNGGWHSRVDRGRVTERGPYGVPLQMVGVSGDVSERRMVDSDSERRFRAIFDSTPQFQCLLDLDCRILEANNSSLGFMGQELELRGLRGQEIWTTPWWPSDEVRERVRLACAEAKAGRFFREEVLVKSSGGRTIHMDLTVIPIIDASGRVTQLLAEGQDVSHRRRVEQELRAVETLTTMGRIAARVAHEINNPLAGIQNSFLLIRDAIPKEHPHYRFVGAIQREIRRIASVTRQLYETYRPESEGSGRVGVRVLISDAVSFLEQVNRNSQVRIVADLGTCPNAVPLPESVLRQSVYNLVQNAVEASPPEGVVIVKAAVSSGHFILRVADQGVGIPEEMRERIFDPFVSTKDRGTPTGGMGIGLSLVRRSVEALGGRMVVESGPGGGAVFILSIPLNQTPGAPT